MAATLAGQVGSTIEGERHLLVRSDGGRCAVQCLAVGVRGAVGCCRQGAVGSSPVGGPCAAVHGRADQRVSEGEVGGQVHQPGHLGGLAGGGRDADQGRRAPDHRGAARGVRGGEEQQHLGVGRECADPSDVPPLQVSVHQQVVRQRGGAGHLVGGELSSEARRARGDCRWFRRRAGGRRRERPRTGSARPAATEASSSVSPPTVRVFSPSSSWDSSVRSPKTSAVPSAWMRRPQNARAARDSRFDPLRVVDDTQQSGRGRGPPSRPG